MQTFMFLFPNICGALTENHLLKYLFFCSGNWVNNAKRLGALPPHCCQACHVSSGNRLLHFWFPFKPKDTVMYLTTPAELMQIKYAQHRKFIEVFFMIINLDLWFTSPVPCNIKCYRFGRTGLERGGKNHQFLCLHLGRISILIPPGRHLANLVKQTLPSRRQEWEQSFRFVWQQRKCRSWESREFLSPVLLPGFASCGAHRVTCSTETDSVSVFLLPGFMVDATRDVFYCLTRTSLQTKGVSERAWNCIVSKPSEFNQFSGSPCKPVAPNKRSGASQYRTGSWSINIP